MCLQRKMVDCAFVAIVVVTFDNTLQKYCYYCRFNYFSKTNCGESTDFSLQRDLMYLVSLENFVGLM